MTIDPLRLSFEIDCPPTTPSTSGRRDSRPGGRRATRRRVDPDTVVTLEPRLGGRIFERTPDGTEIDWGEITSWNPPRRLGYLWHIRRDRSDATDVELTFVDQGDGTTRLEIVHSGWERLGAEGVPWRTRTRTAGARSSPRSSSPPSAKRWRDGTLALQIATDCAAPRSTPKPRPGLDNRYQRTVRWPRPAIAGR